MTTKITIETTDLAAAARIIAALQGVQTLTLESTSEVHPPFNQQPAPALQESGHSVIPQLPAATVTAPIVQGDTAAVIAAAPSVFDKSAAGDHSTAQVAAATAAPAGVEVDSERMPWDARIHSESRSKLANGTWRNKRGIDNALIAQVEAENMALMAIPARPALSAAEASALVQFPIDSSVPPAPTATPAAPAAPEIPVIPAAPAATPTPPPVTATVDASAVFRRVTELQAAQKFPQASVDQACASVGLTKITDVFKRPDLAPALLEVINAIAEGA